MTLNCIWRPEEFGELLLPVPLRLRVVVPLKVPSMSQIDQFKDYLYLIGLYVKI